MGAQGETPGLRRRWAGRHRERRLTALAITVLASAALWLRPVPAMAVLGGQEASVEADQQYLGGRLATLPHPDYTIERITTPSGITIREYVSDSGSVFAIVWRGPRPPDLSRLLGGYFSAYQAAAQEPHLVRGHRRVEANGVVVETGGHMRDLHGRAYLPNQIPGGVRLSEIK